MKSCLGPDFYECPLCKKTTRKAEKHLSQSDPIMARLVSDHGPCSLPEREFRPFCTLVRSIISQQLSSKAADSIRRRVSEIVSEPFEPDGFLSVPVEALKSTGLSAPKARYIHGLATHISEGLLDFEGLTNSPDECVIKALTALPGIGRWTAEMFLIFGLKRPDVLALGDAGLQRAAKMIYGGSDGSAPLEHVSNAWRPYRSVASWYLWEYLDADGR